MVVHDDCASLMAEVIVYDDCASLTAVAVACVQLRLDAQVVNEDE
jgi:hypothetical protein